MRTESLIENAPPHTAALKAKGFEARYDPENDMSFIVRISTCAAVWGMQAEDQIVLMEENRSFKYSVEEMDLFIEAFDEIHSRLDGDGIDCFDEAFTHRPR